MISLAMSIIVAMIFSYLYSHLHPIFNITLVLYVVMLFIVLYRNAIVSRCILNFDYTIETRSLAVGIFFKTGSLFYLVHYADAQTPIILCFGIANLLGALGALAMQLFLMRNS